VDNFLCKYFGRKFCTYPRHIILIILFLKKEKERKDYNVWWIKRKTLPLCLPKKKEKL